MNGKKKKRCNQAHGCKQWHKKKLMDAHTYIYIYILANIFTYQWWISLVREKIRKNI